MKADPLCIGNGQANQPPSELVGALNCMHDQQAVLTYQFAATPTGFNRGQRMLSCYGGVKRVRQSIKTITKALVHGPERSVRYWL